MDNYKVAVIGCGGIGQKHAQGAIGLANVEVVAGCDLSAETSLAFKEKWKDQWPNIALYDDHNKMFEVEKPNIVTIATPDNRHADLVVAAANAGARGVFCEKPLATTLDDADRMITACEKKGTILSVDHTRRFNPLWRHLKEQVIDGGEIGELQYIDGRLSGRRGGLFRNGTHLIDAICYLADSQPEWVFAELEKGYEDHTEYRGDGGRTPELEPSASGYIHFANGVRGFYTGTSKNTAGPKWRFEVMGSQGYITIEKEAVLHRGKNSETIAAPKWEVSGIPLGVRELILAVESGQEVASPGRSALNVLEVIYGFFESQKRDNAKVYLPLPRG